MTQTWKSSSKLSIRVREWLDGEKCAKEAEEEQPEENWRAASNRRKTTGKLVGSRDKEKENWRRSTQMKVRKKNRRSRKRIREKK